MGYKDSFVDEFPYLVYSDDPEATNSGGASGGISSWPISEPDIPIVNSTGEMVDVFCSTDKNFATVNFWLTFSDTESFGSGIPYIAYLADGYAIMTGNGMDNRRIEPIGEFVYDGSQFRVIEIPEELPAGYQQIEIRSN